MRAHLRSRLFKGEARSRHKLFSQMFLLPKQHFLEIATRLLIFFLASRIKLSRHLGLYLSFGAFGIRLFPFRGGFIPLHE